MKVEFEPREPSSGCWSFASWSNDDLQAAIRKAFNESPRERIIRIDITRDGIRAYFEATKRAYFEATNRTTM